MFNKATECHFTYTLSFKIHYETILGEEIYIIGNSPQFGNWNIENAFKLNWTQGNFWKGKIIFQTNRNSILEYKYVVQTKNPVTQENYLRWEEGPNRKINFSQLRNLTYMLDEIWEYRKSMHIIGNCTSLGNLENPQQMKLISKKDPQTQFLEKYWEIEISVPSKTECIQYYYVRSDDKLNKFYAERCRDRTIMLQNNQDIIVQNLESKSPNFKNKDYSQQQKEQIYFRCKNNVYKKIDLNYQEQFQYQYLNSNLIFGNFPYTQEEVQKLKDEGVKAIFYLNNSEETKLRTINWDIITKLFPKNKMEFVDFQIKLDMPKYDQQEKIKEAANILNQMIQSHQKVYVNCTLGKQKVLEVVLQYLCEYRKFSVEAALKFMKVYQHVKSPRTKEKKSPNSKNQMKLLQDQKNININIFSPQCENNNEKNTENLTKSCCGSEQKMQQKNQQLLKLKQSYYKKITAKTLFKVKMSDQIQNQDSQQQITPTNFFQKQTIYSQ